MVDTIGNQETHVLLCSHEADAEGFEKATWAMQVPGGCVVEMEIRREGKNGDYAFASSAVFVPHVKIGNCINGGHRLISTADSWSPAHHQQ